MPQTSNPASEAVNTGPEPVGMAARLGKWAMIFAPTVIAFVVSLGCLRVERWAGDTGLYGAISAKIARGEGAPGLAGWWTLHVSQDVYFNKPPLMFWVHAVCMRALGDGPLGMYLPEIIAYALTVILTQMIVSRLVALSGGVGGRGSGWLTGAIAGLFLVACGQFLSIVDTLKPDYLHNLLLFVSMWMVVVAMDRLRVSRRRAAWWVVASGVPIGLAMLVKPMWGLAGYVPIMAFLALSPRSLGESSALERRDSATAPSPHPAWLCRFIPLAAIAAVLVAAPWHISMWRIHGEAFVETYFVRQTYNRVMTEAFIPEPWYWYLHFFRDTSWPLFVSMMLGLLAFGAWKFGVLRRMGPGSAGLHPSPGEGRPRGALLLGLCWAVFWVAVLSAVPDKRRNYTLHIFPALAMVAAALATWPVGMAKLRSRPTVVLGTAAAALCAVALMFAFSRPRSFERFPLFSEVKPLVAESGLWGPVEAFLRTLKEPVYVGALRYPDAGRLYVRSGVWPRGTGWGNRPDDVIPPGALVIYDSRQAKVPVDDATETVFEHTSGKRRIVILRRK